MSNITVIGGGNVGTLVAASAAMHGHSVTLLVRRMEKHCPAVLRTDHERHTACQVSFHLTDSYAEATARADVIIIAVPGTSTADVLTRLRDELRSDIPVGSVFASSGDFVRLVSARFTSWFGMERVPYVSRLDGPGRVELLSHKARHNIYFSPACPAGRLIPLIEQIMEAPVSMVEHPEQVMVSNSNPLLHPARLSTLSPIEDAPPRLYVDWPDAASRTLIRMDDELRRLFVQLHIPPIASITEHYGVTDARGLTLKIRSIPSFQNIEPPYIRRADGRWQMDLRSRYFAEDYEIDLRTTIEILHDHGLPCPEMERVYNQYLETKQWLNTSK